MDTSEQYIKMSDCPEIRMNYKTVSTDFQSFWGGEEVWLPRQDQIQEMMRKDYENTLDMLCDFYAVITVDQPTGFQQMFEVSMEQLWLAFYMWEKYGKVWDGNKWLKKQ